jgi:hypothetical protein
VIPESASLNWWFGRDGSFMTVSMTTILDIEKESSRKKRYVALQRPVVKYRGFRH